MSIFDRIGGLMQQNNRINKGVTRDKNGIEIWNRDGDNIVKTVFPESWSREDREKVWEYTFYPVGFRFEDSLKDGFTGNKVEKKGGLLTLDDFFSPGTTVLELGCGGGQAAMDLARKYRGIGVKYLAVDHEMGDRIAEPIHFLPNLKFDNVDWNEMSFKNESIDRILSRQGVARYGGERAAKEMTRIAKTGAIFRGDEDDRGVYGRRNFSDHLYEMGWNVWKLGGGLMVAQKVK
jgi:SAM-dependent methyltransferase